MAQGIIVDIELEGNFDDAFCLALAARSPEVELVAVIVTALHARESAKLARNILDLYGATDVPVILGCYPHPKMPSKLAPHRFGILADHLGEKPLPLSQLSEIVSGRSHLTYIGNAPLTTLSTLLTQEPTVAKTIEGITFMGGWPSQALPEWNTQRDAVAVNQVIRCGKSVSIIGFDVTLNCVCNERHLQQLRDHPGALLLKSMFELWSRETKTRKGLMHDPLPLAALLDPSLVHFVPMGINVHTDLGPGYGILYRDDHAGQLVNVAVDCDPQRYLSLLLDRIGSLSQEPSKILFQVPSIHLEVRNVLEVEYPPHWPLKDTIAPRHIIGLVTKGAGALYTTDGAVHLQEKTVVYLPKGQRYQIRTSENEMQMTFTYFDVWKSSYGQSQKSPEPLLSKNAITWEDADLGDYILRQFARLRRTWQDPNPPNMLRSQSILLDIFSSLLECESQSNRHTPEQQSLIRKAKGFLKARIESTVSLDELSNHVGVNKFHLIRLFKAIEGVTPMRYHLKLRILRATALLEQGQMSIKEIASSLGYGSIQAFSQAFSREVGISPSEYAKRVLRKT